MQISGQISLELFFTHMCLFQCTVSILTPSKAAQIFELVKDASFELNPPSTRSTVRPAPRNKLLRAAAQVVFRAGFSWVGEKGLKQVVNPGPAVAHFLSDAQDTTTTTVNYEKKYLQFRGETGAIAV